jgi:protein TonB
MKHALRVLATAVAILAPHPSLAPPVAAAAPQLKVFFAADFKDAVYQKKTYDKVASSWRRPATTPRPGAKAVVIAVIQKDGAAPEPVLHFKSGSDAWDAAALEAVRKAAPFEPLPKGYPRPSVEVHFHFEYN